MTGGDIAARAQTNVPTGKRIIPHAPFQTKNFTSQHYSSLEERKLYIYLSQYTWVYDEPRLDIEAEPFVDGADEIIQELSRRCGSEYMIVRFYDTLVDECSPVLDFVSVPEHGGAIYQLRGTELRGWLCAHLFDYFKIPPALIQLVLTPTTRHGDEGRP